MTPGVMAQWIAVTLFGVLAFAMIWAVVKDGLKRIRQARRVKRLLTRAGTDGFRAGEKARKMVEKVLREDEKR